MRSLLRSGLVLWVPGFLVFATQQHGMAQTVADSFRIPLDGAWNPSRAFGEFVKDPTKWCGYHLADDVPRNAETPVFPMAKGKIKYVAKSVEEGLGYVVVIEHLLPTTERVSSIYYHMRFPRLGETAWSQGDDVLNIQAPIGFVSGNPKDHGVDSAPHLHFGVRKEPTTFPEKDNRTERWFYPGYSTIYRGFNRQCREPDDTVQPELQTQIHAEILREWCDPQSFVENKSCEGGFNFALDEIQVTGNIPGGFLDNFNDGSLTNSPTSEFFCLNPVNESAGFLNLRSGDGANRFTPGFVVDNCQLGVQTGTTRLVDGRGSATITATFRADIPASGQEYGIQLVTFGSNELVNVAVSRGNGPVVRALAQSSSGARTVQSRPANMIGKQRVLLRLVFDDTSNQVIPSFSTDGGLTFEEIALGGAGRVMSGLTQAFVSVFGAAVVP